MQEKGGGGSRSGSRSGGPCRPARVTQLFPSGVSMATNHGEGEWI